MSKQKKTCNFLNYRKIDWTVLEKVILLGTFIVISIGTVNQCSSVRDQKNNFILRNRPYVQVVEEDFKIKATGRYRINSDNNNPEIELIFTIPFMNHGPVPASIESVDVYIHHELKKIEADEGVLIGQQQKDDKNLDIFPYLSDGVKNVRSSKRKVYLNVHDAQNLFKEEIDKNKIMETKDKNDELADIPLSNYLDGLFSHDEFSDFFVAVQIKYTALGEAASLKPFFYWVIFKMVNDPFDDLRGVVFQKSGIGKRFH
jgi:hypothetical protein